MPIRRHDFFIEKPTIAVLGLNPHAGDEGALGEEEEMIIRPAIEQAKTQGILAMGPFPADGFFGSGFSDADSRIQKIADGVINAGTPSDWRAINMCHHITAIVAGLGKQLGYSIEVHAPERNPMQLGFDMAEA